MTERIVFLLPFTLFLIINIFILIKAPMYELALIVWSMLALVCALLFVWGLIVF